MSGYVKEILKLPSINSHKCIQLVVMQIPNFGFPLLNKHIRSRFVGSVTVGTKIETFLLRNMFTLTNKKASVTAASCRNKQIRVQTTYLQAKCFKLVLSGRVYRV